jgi:hypothetical protein
MRHHFGITPPGADFADMRTENTDNGYDVVCGGAYKHLRPEVTSLVVFGDPKAGISMTIDEIGQLHSFVADEVLVALASRVK